MVKVGRKAGSGNVHLYHCVGRKKPTAEEAQPQIYRMKIFAPNKVVAHSKFFYFISKFRKMKRSTAEIIACDEIFEKRPLSVKNFGIWLRYNSRTDPVNMYKEYRDTTLTGAVAQMYAEMAGRHRARATTVQIIRTTTLKPSECRRPSVMQYHNSKISFPLPHRIPRAPTNQFKTTFKAQRPNTVY